MEISGLDEKLFQLNREGASPFVISGIGKFTIVTSMYTGEALQISDCVQSCGEPCNNACDE